MFVISLSSTLLENYAKLYGVKHVYLDLVFLLNNWNKLKTF